ncbi:MAG: sulfatase-like hydrolase/transferase [Acidobacteriota bacterium]|nr:sulfatase-like hydrolase/transferase [Acidobacteriota bacterium]
MAARPNILMIVVDCLRSDRIFGPDRTSRTPRIDDFAAKARAFPRMFVENPITSPSFASILTGCYSLTHGVTSLLGVQMDEGLATLPGILEEHGYHTYAEVTGPLLPMLGIGRGFGEYAHRSQNWTGDTRWGRRLLERFRKGGFTAPWFVLVHLWEIHEPRHVPPAFRSRAFGATAYDRAWSALDGFVGDLIGAAGSDALVILTGDHGERVGETVPPGTLLPYFMDKLGIARLDREEDSRVQEDLVLYKKRGRQLHDVSRRLDAYAKREESPIEPRNRIQICLTLIRIALTRLRTQRFHPTPAGLREMWRLKKEDFRIGLAVGQGDSRAAQRQILRVTLSQFHLQHGYHIYDYLAQVPFLIAGPPLKGSPRRQRSAVRNIDILPTFCDLLELGPPPGAPHGRSFAPLLNSDAVEERPLYMEARGGAQATRDFYIRGLRSGAWKIAYAPFDAEAPLELYDLAADAREEANRAPERTEIAAALRAEAEKLAGEMSGAEAGAAWTAAEQAVLVEKLRSLGYM